MRRGNNQAKTRPVDSDLPAAIRMDDLTAVRCMLAQGADPNACNPREPKAPALIVALGYQNAIPRWSGSGKAPKQTAIFHALLDAGADVNVRYNGCTPLHMAVMCGMMGDNTEIIALMLDRGAEVDARDDDGATPLMYAAHHNKSKVIRFLLKRGADVNAQDEGGNTPIMYTTMFGYYEAAQVLMAQGADLTIKNNHGKTVHEYVPEWRPDLLSGKTMVKGESA